MEVIFLCLVVGLVRGRGKLAFILRLPNFSNIENPLERDIFLKRSMGFGESTFFLLSKLLG